MTIKQLLAWASQYPPDARVLVHGPFGDFEFAQSLDLIAGHVTRDGDWVFQKGHPTDEEVVRILTD